MGERRTDWFADFVVAYRSDAIRLAWRLLGPDRHMAEDIVQQAFARAWHRRMSFRGASNPRTWVYRIIVNQVRSHQRWKAVRTRALGWLRHADIQPMDIAALSDHGLKHRIGMAMECLSNQQREAFVLVYLDGYSIRETAVLLDRAVGTVKSHLHRALGKLRTELSDVWEDVS